MQTIAAYQRTRKGDTENLKVILTQFNLSKFSTTVLLRLYAMVQLWTAEGTNATIKVLRDGRSSRHAPDLSEVPRTCLRRKLTVE
jgi:hypothetical protein